MQFSAFIEWAFLAVVSGGVFILWQMKENISSLNAKIEVVIVNLGHTENKVNDHENRIRLIEKLKIGDLK